MTANKKVLLTIGCLVAGAAILFVAAFYFSMVSTVMTKTSPDGLHTAKLVRVRGIDVNFNVTVDGLQVFNSPDFAPVHADFREQIVWDADSKAVVLEVGGQRIFGYHANERRELSDAELLDVQFTPFSEFRFEGVLPTESAKQSPD
ncbi:MAG TPA: hypothetical protein VHU84_05595 [Lacipirellulaceae bacterium]|jgi:hypothetical protein|nr:hypothetical protein [Lacipirellulaceae bacterium]